MENEIEKFDPSKLMDGVKDRIKATFVSLIPDDAWEKMIEKEIYIFTEGRITYDRKTDWGTTDENGNHPIITEEIRTPYSGKLTKDNWSGKEEYDISPLQKMIRDALREKFAEDVKAFLDGDDYKTFFDEHGNEKVKKTLEDMLVKNAGSIFVNIISGMMQRGIEQMKYNISNNGSNY